MKKIFTLFAAAMLSTVAFAQASLVSFTFDGKTPKNGETLNVNAIQEDTPVGPMIMYDVHVNVVLEVKETINKITVTAVDLDKVAPGISFCPRPYSCESASAGNNWTSSWTADKADDPNLKKGAKMENNISFLHYNYVQNKPADNLVRKSHIKVVVNDNTSDVLEFDLVATVPNPSGIDNVEATSNTTDNAIYNLAGQRVTNDAHGIVIKGGKKYVVK